MRHERGSTPHGFSACAQRLQASHNPLWIPRTDESSHEGKYNSVSNLIYQSKKKLHFTRCNFKVGEPDNFILTSSGKSYIWFTFISPLCSLIYCWKITFDFLVSVLKLTPEEFLFDEILNQISKSTSLKNSLKDSFFSWRKNLKLGYVCELSANIHRQG